jgi:hypothetical protein|tara:strand:+ start:14832 stop:14936 length:105 start_codon:yes stop_codon:yes gene_type:complete
MTIKVFGVVSRRLLLAGGVCYESFQESGSSKSKN